MRSILYILEVSFNPRGWEEVGLIMFFLSLIALGISLIGFFITLIVYLANKSLAYKLPLKISLISLLAAGVSLLLTSVMCGWFG